MSQTPSQQEVFDLLSDPRSFGPGVEKVERFDTHISAVFLAGDRVFKLKRAVRLPFLDFSTCEKRRLACLAELMVNRRTAPELYLGVSAITREPDGRLAIDGSGDAEDWLVVMKRFEQDTLFDRMAAEGRLTLGQAGELAEAVARFHSDAAPRPNWGGEKGLRHTIDTNAVCFAQHMPLHFHPVAAGRVTEGSLAWLTRLAPLLEARRAAGLVRLCHGDLHLGNICLVEGRPTLFDGIEFNDDFACIDVLYDLAFLLMDLRARGLPVMACQLFNRYLELRPDLEGLMALPLFLSLRAAIRAHVCASMALLGEGSEALRRDSLGYLDMAQGYLAPPPPRMLAVGGLSGTGKSRLGRDMAPLLGAAPGAVILRTDVIRKRLMGVDPETRLPPQGYTTEMTERTYRVFYDDCERALSAGHAVVADAVFAKPEQRQAIEAVARRHGVPFDGLWLDADPAVMRSRIEARKKNASDATVAVLEQQLEYELGEIAWHRVDSSGPKEDTFINARSVVGL